MPRRREITCPVTRGGGTKGLGYEKIVTDIKAQSRWTSSTINMPYCSCKRIPSENTMDLKTIELAVIFGPWIKAFRSS